MTYQVSVFLENKIGHLEKVTSILKDNHINILAMNLNHTSAGWGIVNLLVDKPELAHQRLSESGISAALRQIAVIRMEDAPGSLDGLLKKIAAAGINFTTAFGRSGCKRGVAWFAIDVEDFPDAGQKMVSAGIEILSDETVYSNG